MATEGWWWWGGAGPGCRPSPNRLGRLAASGHQSITRNLDITVAHGVRRHEVSGFVDGVGATRSRCQPGAKRVYIIRSRERWAASPVVCSITTPPAGKTAKARQSGIVWRFLPARDILMAFCFSHGDVYIVSDDSQGLERGDGGVDLRQQCRCDGRILAAVKMLGTIAAREDRKSVV